MMKMYRMKMNTMAVIDRFVRAAVDLPAGTIVLRFKSLPSITNQSSHNNHRIIKTHDQNQGEAISVRSEAEQLPCLR